MEETQPSEKRNPEKKENKGLNDYIKYSGLAFQMVAIIAFTAWVGIKLDEITGTGKPVFTTILSLLGVFAAIYTAVRDFIK